MTFLDKIFGDPSKRHIKEMAPIIKKINELESSFESLSVEELRAKTDNFRSRLKNGDSLDNILPEAFAAVREASKRTLGLRHFDVQLMGGITLHQGNIAEMRTGEGKTLVATLPAYLNALSGAVHVVTVNDYLARRDAVWMGQIYSMLGLTVGVISHDSSFAYDESQSVSSDVETTRDKEGDFHVVNDFLKPIGRIDAYRSDILYGTNSEFGFDYLRDNLEYNKESIRQNEHTYAIVDEIDSILIDEARTPLIISAPVADSDNLYVKFAEVANKLDKDIHYTVDEKLHSVLINQDGITKAEEILGIDNIYGERGIKMVHHLELALKAKALYTEDKEYVVRNGQVVIVDTYTGRLQPGRRWSDGLHQAVEAKEGLSIQKESKTYASISYQNYFRMYKKLSGMTGTAVTSREEFYKVYGLNTIVIPTNKLSARIDQNDLIFQTESGKHKAIARKVKELQQKGQPVLVGTVSIEDNEIIGEYFKREGIRFEMLNAKNHEREGEIIAQAGRKSSVTIATNMAGRGVDIKLGGNPATKEQYEEVKNLGGLFVLGTERHDARRIDNQLRGRSGRQGDPGATQFYVSLEDRIMRVFATDTVKSMMGRLGLAEDEPIENKLITKSLESAQERIEGLNFDARKHLLEYDDVLNFQRKIFYERRREVLLNEQDERVRNLKLQAHDMFWVDHLETMDYLRSSVNLRAYGQRDPLVEYKKEGLRLFKEMEGAINNTVEENLKKIESQDVTLAMGDVQKPARLNDFSHSGGQAEKITMSGSSPQSAGSSLGNQYKDVGRNDPCPCGSGKKFKKCHGANV